MRSKLSKFVPAGLGAAKVAAMSLAAILMTALTAHAAPEPAGGEANLKLPDLSSVTFLTA